MPDNHTEYLVSNQGISCTMWITQNTYTRTNLEKTISENGPSGNQIREIIQCRQGKQLSYRGRHCYKADEPLHFLSHWILLMGVLYQLLVPNILAGRNNRN